MKLLDLFCGAGLATKGYQKAGFYVVGVDIKNQPNYCGDEFHLGNVIDPDGFFSAHRWEFDAIHASPPCQAFTIARHMQKRSYPDLIMPTRTMLENTDIPWVIENVPGAPIRPDIILCGTQFGLKANGKQIRRHRWFEIRNWKCFQLLPPCNHFGRAMQIFGHGGKLYSGADEWREAMDVWWTTRNEISQGIPPAFTEWIGKQLINYLEKTRK